MKRIIIACILIASFFYFTGINPFKSLERMKGIKSDDLEKIRQSKLRTSYVLDNEKWALFPLDAATDRFKVLSNANFPVSLNLNYKQRWWYVLQFQVLDKNKKVIIDRKYHHHTQATQYYGTENGEPFFPRFYLDEQLVAADMRMILFNFKDCHSASFIRLRLGWKDPDIIDVVVRVYIEEKIPKRKIAYLWQRMSDERKTELAKGNVYHHELLVDQEKRNILNNMWKPLGPIGVEDEDYRVRNLYVFKDFEGEEGDSGVMPQGLFIDRNHRGIVPIPENGGMILLDILSFGNIFNTPPTVLKAKWFGIKATERSQETFSFSEKSKLLEIFLKGGLLELETSRDIVVRAFLKDKNPENEITPEPLVVRTYITHENHPLTFDVRHLENQDTPFRIDGRYILPSGAKLSDRFVPSLKYEMLDSEGRITNNGMIELSPNPSVYDKALRAASGEFLSEPSTVYFSFPKKVVQLRFYSQYPVMLAGYNRQLGFEKKTRIPEDFFKYNLKDEERQPTWFALQPVGAGDLFLENRSRLINVQYRPPEDKEDILNSPYEWEAYLPEELWRGRYLFTPFESKRPLRREQLPSVYRPLPTGEELKIHFKQPSAGMKTIQPSLLFFKKTSSRASLSIYLDDKPLYQTSISGTRGEVKLPPVLIGSHRIKAISSIHLDLFINYAEPGETAFSKRFAVFLDDTGLRFNYEKKTSGEEILLVHYFVPTGYKEPSHITVNIDGKKGCCNEPFSSWTLLNHRFVLRPNPKGSVPVLYTQGDYVDQGRLFFFALGDDLHQGSHQIRFKLERGERGYLIFSKITYGLFERRRFFYEKDMF